MNGARETGGERRRSPLQEPPLRHDWPTDTRAARALQEDLRGRVRVEPLDVDGLRFVAGCDLSANRFERRVYAGVVVLELPELAVVDRCALAAEAPFPYVPGLLSFREIPPLLAVWERLRVVPDAAIFDGQGIAHPRRMGLAAHAGLALGLPTVGCAKSRLVGEHAPLGEAAGARVALLDGDEVIGQVVRTRTGVKPVYVSVGHRCRLEDAVALVQRCRTRYRLPETTRRAHALVNQLRRGEIEPCDFR